MPAPNPHFLLPTLNEETGLPRTIAAIRRSFPKAPILVVDGHSTDHTRAIAKRLGCRVLLQSGRGKGNALIEALRALPAAAAVALLDADGSYDPADIKAMLARYRGRELMLGNRFAAPTQGAFTGTNLLGNRLLNLVASVLFARRLQDMLTGIRLFPCNAVRKLGLTASNFEIETEMTLKALKAGMPIIEVPCRYSTRAGVSKLSPAKDGFRIFRRILKERFSRPSAS